MELTKSECYWGCIAVLVIVLFVFGSMVIPDFIKHLSASPSEQVEQTEISNQEKYK